MVGVCMINRHLASMVVAAMVLLAVALTAPANASDADSAFLERIAGTWRGTGQVRSKPGAARERVNCRMTATWDAGRGRLSMNFDCRGVDIQFSTSGFLTSLENANRIEGQWRGGGRVGQSSVSGRRNGNSVSLTVTSQDRDTGRELRGSFSMRLSGGSRLTSTIRAQDAETRQRFTALSLSLSR